MKDCKRCNGEGIVFLNNEKYKCLCIQLREIVEYLGEYRSYEFFEDEDRLSKLSQIPFLFLGRVEGNFNLNSFSSYAKSYLIYSLKKGKKLTFKTVTTSDVVDLTIKSIEDKQFLDEVDIIFLIIDYDSPNSKFEEFLTSFLLKRILKRKPVWIFSSYAVDSFDFRVKYGEKSYQILSENFTKIKFKTV